VQEYYNRRAQEYEQIYRREEPLRQAELAELAKAMQAALSGRLVLEIACGTGYWTQIAARVARHITATDASAEMLEIARSKNISLDQVQFGYADAYDLASISDQFDAALVNFWLSHVPRLRLRRFLSGLHDRLCPGSTIFMADNAYVPGVGGEIVSFEGSVDTYKRRTLSDGSSHVILKNYYSSDELATMLSPFTEQVEITVGACFWWVVYTIG
jgi:SAM-dependent methyltransferase